MSSTDALSDDHIVEQARDALDALHSCARGNDYANEYELRRWVDLIERALDRVAPVRHPLIERANKAEARTMELEEALASIRDNCPGSAAIMARAALGEHRYIELAVPRVGTPSGDGNG